MWFLFQLLSHELIPWNILMTLMCSIWNQIWNFVLIAFLILVLLYFISTNCYLVLKSEHRLIYYCCIEHSLIQFPWVSMTCLNMSLNWLCSSLTAIPFWYEYSKENYKGELQIANYWNVQLEIEKKIKSYRNFLL